MPNGDEGELAAAWAAIRAGLRRDCGARLFDHWLKPIALAESDDHRVVRLTLPSEFMANWVAAHYADRLTLAWRNAVPAVREVRIEAANDSSPARYTAEAETPVVTLVPPADTHSSPLEPRFTFDQFVASAENRVALSAAQGLATGDHRFNPLFLHSPTGQGKTHLMHAIGHEVRRRRPGARVLYMSAERFMVEFVSAMRDKDTLGFKTRLRSADLLMIDDVQFIAGKGSTQEEFLHTINEVMSAGKSVVISADRSPPMLEGVEGRILSRLASGLVVDIKPASYELRLAIVVKKLEALPDVFIPQEVAELMAARIQSSIRELEGAINRLAAYAMLNDRAIDLDFAQEVLGELLTASTKRITIDDIQRTVSAHFNIRQSEMVSARRARAVARPRQIAMYLAKRLTPRSLPEIGRRFGGRDHTTVIHAVRQIERLRGCDADIDADVRTLLRTLEG